MEGVSWSGELLYEKNIPDVTFVYLQLRGRGRLRGFRYVQQKWPSAYPPCKMFTYSPSWLVEAVQQLSEPSSVDSNSL